MFRGHQGMEELFRVWMTEPWQGSLQMEPAHVIDLGDGRVLPLITFRGTGRGSGVPVELEYAHLAHFSNGAIRRVDGHTTWERALRAVGLDEVPHPAGGG